MTVTYYINVSVLRTESVISNALSFKLDTVAHCPVVPPIQEAKAGG